MQHTRLRKADAQQYGNSSRSDKKHMLQDSGLNHEDDTESVDDTDTLVDLPESENIAIVSLLSP